MDARAQAPDAANVHAYLPVEDLPANRKTPAMTTDDQAKLKKDLDNARARQAAIEGQERIPASRDVEAAV